MSVYNKGISMKTPIKNCFNAAVLAGFLVTASVASAQSTTTTTTSSTTTAGTISEFSPNVITVRSTTSATPVSYSYSKTTTYVDQDGNPVAMETVKSGLPVTVYYTQDGDRMVASRVVVQRTSSPDTTTIKKTTTTTTSGE
jgi:hypothetical protein